jgi:hypothetical protein
MSNDQLPDRDPTKTNAQYGLYGKFRIERTDGSSAPGGKHHGCDYFVLDVTHDKHAAVALATYAGAVAATHPQLAADMRARWGLPAQPAGDAALPVVAIYSPDEPVDEDGDVRMPVVDLGDDEILAHKRRIRPDRRFDGLVSQRDAQAAIAARDALVAGLEADLVEERNRIADMRKEWGAEVAALTARITSLEAEGAKSERRALTFGDALHRNILAMRAALADCHRHGPHHGMHWIVNTLAGPGHLPGADDVAIGGQALFDKEVAEYEAFRAANPGPVAPATAPATPAASSMPPAADAQDPMDWPLPCDVVVGHGPMRKGVRLGTLVSRMKVLYEMATGRNADVEEHLTGTERQARFDSVFGGSLMTDLGAAFDADPGLSGDLSADEAGLAACVTCGAPVDAPAPRDTDAMLAEHMLLMESYSGELVSDYLNGHGEQSGTRSARLTVEASARKLLGEA